MFTSALQSSESSIHKEQALSGDMLKIYRKPSENSFRIRFSKSSALMQSLSDCVSVNGVILSFADITATNGVLHIIDHTI